MGPNSCKDEQVVSCATPPSAPNDRDMLRGEMIAPVADVVPARGFKAHVVEVGAVGAEAGDLSLAADVGFIGFHNPILPANRSPVRVDGALAEPNLLRAIY